jgi:hypothetical protein
MSESGLGSKLLRFVGWLMLLVGVSVFAIRLQHAGPYALPEGGNLLAGVLALLLGGWLVRPWLGSRRLAAPLAWLALVASPIVLFFALYATLSELEEVVVLKATHRSGRAADLRLWIVDRPDGAWVTMPRSKAQAHGLSDARVELLRQGEVSCVVTTLHEDRATANEIHRLRHQKYGVQRFATSIGLFGRSAGENTVALRLDPCPGG